MYFEESNMHFLKIICLIFKKMKCVHTIGLKLAFRLHKSHYIFIIIYNDNIIIINNNKN